MVRASGKGGFLKGTLAQDDEGMGRSRISVGAQDITSDLVMPLGPGRFAEPTETDRSHPAARPPTFEEPLAKAPAVLVDDTGTSEASSEEGGWERRRELRDVAEDELGADNYKAYSARTEKELRHFAEHAKARQGTLKITKDGVLLQGAENDIVTKQKRITDFAAADRKIRTFMKKDFGSARAAFSKFDANRDGVLTVREFENGLQNLHLGLSDAQIREVVRNVDFDGSGEVSYPEFLSRFGGDNNGKVHLLKMDKKRKKFNKKLKPAPRHDPTDEVVGDADSKLMPELVCALGVFLWPIWCFGWIWLNSKDQMSKRLGRCSALLSSLCCIGGVLAGVIVFISIENNAVVERHCEEFNGVLVSIRLAGNNARLSTFWDVRIDDYSKQLKFKRAVYTLYEQVIAERGGARDRSILLDEIQALTNQDDGSSLQMTFRMVTPTVEEAQGFIKYAKQWVLDGSLLQALSADDMPFDSADLTSIVPPLAQDSLVSTPVVFQQTRTIRISGRLNDWINEPSVPFLMRSPPLSTNVMDPFNPDWSHHNATYLKTCWWTQFYILPSDACLESQDIDCEATGANDRAMQVELLSNSTIDVFRLYVRQFIGTVGAESSAPMPTWFTDPEEAVQGVAERDLERCASTRTTSCKFKYTISIAKGAKSSFFWIGVVGSTAEARYVSFNVRTRHIKGYQNQAATNPFVDIALADQRSGGGRPAGTWGWALVLCALVGERAVWGGRS